MEDYDEVYENLLHQCRYHNSFYRKYEDVFLDALLKYKIEILGDEIKELDPDDWHPYYLPISWMIPDELCIELCKIGESVPAEEQDSFIQKLVADNISKRRSEREMLNLRIAQSEEAEYLDYWYDVQFQMEIA